MVETETISQLTQNLRVLYVEDQEEVRKQVKKLLDLFFAEVIVAEDGVEGIKKFNETNPDLTISDIAMPRKSGLDLVRDIRNTDPNHPVIMLTAHSQTEFLLEGIRLNIDGYILKPVSRNELLETLYKVCSQISQKKELEKYRQDLEKMVEDKVGMIQDLNTEIEGTLRETLFTLGEIAEARSQELSAHVKRVGEYCYLMAILLGLSDEEASQLRLASALHDIGKIAIPDSILKKPGKLSPTEYDVMKSHALRGYEMLKNSKRSLFEKAAIVALTHHEKWNGSGYPYGHAGEDIHIYGRITAIADVFDALSNDRVYKKAWSITEVMAHIQEESGKHFDPKIVALLQENLEEFLAIREQFAC